MRHLNTARGQHRKATSLTRRLFAFCEGTGTSAGDLIGGTALTLAGTPAWASDGWIGPRHLVLDGVDDRASGGGVGADTATLVATAWTIGLAWRRRASAAGTIFCVGGNTGTAAGNVLARLNMSAAGALTFEWESGVGVLHSVAVPTYVLPLDRWVYLHLVRTAATTVQVWANCRLVATLAMGTANATGTDAVWSVGSDENAGSFIRGDAGSLYVEAAALAAAALAEDFRRATLQAFPTSVRARVKVKDGLAAYRNLTSQEGNDFVESISINANADDPCETLDLELTREVDFLSIANLVTSSKLNLTDAMVLSSYSPLVDVQREVLVEFARVPMEHPAVSADWVGRFYGHIDSIDWGGDGAVKVSARDPGGRLVDDFLTTDLAMPLTSGGACSSDSVTGERRASVEEAITDIIGASPALYAPTPANLCLVPWEQKKTSKMDAARQIAGTKAWSFGYRFDESPSQLTWRPTLIDPGRDRVDADGVFSALDYAQLGRAALEVFGIRTQVLLTWSDKNDTDGPAGQGNKVRKTSTYADTTSRDRFGGFHRTILISEDPTSPIDEQSEADTMGNGILADLKDPTVDAEAPINDCFFEAEVGDYNTYFGDNVHHTGDLVLATTAVRLGYANGAGDCVLGVRGKATAGSRRWLSADARPGMEARPWDNGATGGGASWGQTGGDARVTTENLIERTQWFNGEHRGLNRNEGFNMISRGANFLPDLWYRSTSTDVKDTDPLTTGRLRTATAQALLDKTLVSTGNVALKLVGAIPQVSSESFPVQGGRPYAVAHNALTTETGANTLHVNVYWYDQTKTFISYTEIGFPGHADDLNITAIDDTGGGGRVQITFDAKHGMVVGEKFIVTAAGAFNGTYTVRTVMSTTQVECDEVVAGAAGTSGKASPFRFQDVYGGNFSVMSPGNAKSAIIAIERLLNTTSYAVAYFDSLWMYKVMWDAFVTATLTATAVDTWATLDLAIGSGYDHGSAVDVTNDRWVCPESGLYDVIAQATGSLAFSSGMGNFYGFKTRLRKNGTSLIESLAGANQGVAGTTATGVVQITHSAAFEKGDTLDLQAIMGNSFAGAVGATPFTASGFLKIKMRQP